MNCASMKFYEVTRDPEAQPETRVLARRAALGFGETVLEYVGKEVGFISMPVSLTLIST